MRRPSWAKCLIGNAGNYGTFRIEGQPPVPRSQESANGDDKCQSRIISRCSVYRCSRAGCLRLAMRRVARLAWWWQMKLSYGSSSQAGIRWDNASAAILSRGAGLGGRLWAWWATSIKGAWIATSCSPIYRSAPKGGALADPQRVRTWTPLIPAIEKLVASIDRDQPIYDVRTMKRRLDASLGSRQFNAVPDRMLCLHRRDAGVHRRVRRDVLPGDFCGRPRSASAWRWGVQPAQVLGHILREGLVLGALGSVLGIAGRAGLEPLSGDAALRRQYSRDASTYSIFTVMLLGVVFAASSSSRASRGPGGSRRPRCVTIKSIQAGTGTANDATW